MARIPADELERIKREVSLLELVEREGVVLEAVVLATDLNGDSLADLITVGYDEGGQIPRMFLSRGGLSYRSIGIPREYSLRAESEWGTDCLRRVLPRLDSDNRIVLARETLSRSGTTGHGSDCTLPVDTLVISGDSLRRLEH